MVLPSVFYLEGFPFGSCTVFLGRPCRWTLLGCISLGTMLAWATLYKWHVFLCNMISSLRELGFWGCIGSMDWLMPGQHILRYMYFKQLWTRRGVLSQGWLGFLQLELSSFCLLIGTLVWRVSARVYMDFWPGVLNYGLFGQIKIKSF